MEKSISISYLLNNKAASVSVMVRYNIERIDNIQTITFTVFKGEDAIPLWLHPHKFEVRSLYNKGKYETLFNSENAAKNLDAALFIDEAYAAIMTREKLQVS